MRRALLAALLVAGAASAQTAELRPLRHAGIGAACGVVGGALTVAALDGQSVQTPLATAAFVLGTAGCLWADARRSGHAGRFLPTLGEATLGLGAGVVVGLATGAGTYVLLDGVGANPDDLGAGTLTVLVAFAAPVVAATALLPAYLLPAHARAVEAAPVALRLPDGSAATGLALRVAL